MAIAEAVLHCAYNVISPLTVSVAPTAYCVPEPSAAVFQPLKMKPVLARLPVLSDTEMVVSLLQGALVSVATLPLVLPLPS